MSWFDTSGIANIAKTALKEAQRTIDKALDIKEDDSISAPANTPIDTNSDDFFGTWGLSQSGNIKNDRTDDVVTRSPTKNSVPKLTSSSIWGSFTGSFFEQYNKDSSLKKHERDSVESLDDSVDVSEEHFSGSKLVVHDDSDTSFSRLSSCEVDEEHLRERHDVQANEISNENSQVTASENTAMSVKRRDKPGSAHVNRLSVISTDSDRRSSESVEILSGSTGCTTSPDSEALSLSSSAQGSKQTSESVEILPNSLTSPSSVEVIGSDSLASRRQSQYTDEFVSPLQTPDDFYGFSHPEKVTPDSIEIIPDDENSVAEDTISYNSVSESTATTILEGQNLPFKQKPQALSLIRSETVMSESVSSDVTLSPEKSEVPITRAPSRSGMHLNLTTENSPRGSDNNRRHGFDEKSEGNTKEPLIPEEAVRERKLIDTQPQSFQNQKKTNDNLQIERRPETVSSSQKRENPPPKQKEEPSETKQETSLLHRKELLAQEKIANQNRGQELLIDTQPQSSRQDILSLMKNPNVIDIPQQERKNPNVIDIPQDFQSDEGFNSDKTMVEMESSSDTSTTTDNSNNTNSFYLKNLLADAMTERREENQAGESGKNDPSGNRLKCSDNRHLKDLTGGFNKSGDFDENSQLCDFAKTMSDSTRNAQFVDLSCDLTQSAVDFTKNPNFLDLTQSMIDSTQAQKLLENITISQLEMPPRETSPLSSESRSDLVKIGSDHTSAHTSGDELETTTSSDIEIISSPNGDSSSTHSRHSPAKLTAKTNKPDPAVDSLLGKMTFKKIKGHNRELSEASSLSDDTEIERLIKRLSEMTEILESREYKLVEINRKNSELQELNTDLRKQLDNLNTKQNDSINLNTITEEYTQRLSALERKFQQAIREKDGLRKQLETAKTENAMRMSKGEMDAVMEEKEQIIKELREEGEKLSKQQLQHSNIIKKLRAKEKEHETTIKHLKDTVEDLTLETDRLKRSLTAKEEVERSQIEAVHQLTAKNKKVEFELARVQEANDDLSQKYDTVKKSLDAAKKELVDKNRASAELVQREQMLQSLENEKRMTESQNEEIINQLEDLRSKLRETDRDYLKKEHALRAENNELLRRLEVAESRNEELSQSVLEVSKPLVRQLEALQAMHNTKVAHFEKIEQELLIKLNEAQSKLQNASETKKLVKEELYTLKSKLSASENEMVSCKHENELLKAQLEQSKNEKVIYEQEVKKEIEVLQDKIKNEYSTIEALQKEVEHLQQALSVEKTSHESEKRRLQVLQDQLRDKQQDPSLGGTCRTSSPNAAGNISPTLSLGRVSLSESLNSSLWPLDEPFEVNTSSSRCTNMLEMQLLQTGLKQRDGEVQQLQWELNRREHERTLLNTEISNLLSRVEELETKCATFDATQTELAELQRQYETLCQLYGEKVEETEELKLDLVDVKEMYKGQIDELLRQQRASNS